MAILSIVTVVFSIPMLLWLRAIEHKHITGYAELDLISIMSSILFGIIPFVNLFFVFAFIANTSSNIVVWTNKK